MFTAITNYYQGFKQALPGHSLFSHYKRSEALRSAYRQAIYFNLLYYMLPVLLYNFFINPLLSFFNLDKNESRVNYIVSNAYLYICIRIILEFLLYNTLFTACAARLGAIGNHELDKEIEKFNNNSHNPCSCEQKSKLKSIILSPVNYLSNKLFANVVQYTISPILAEIMRVHIYGRALVESNLNTTGICVKHGQQWLSDRNMLCLGVGSSFVLAYTLVTGLFNYSLDIFNPAAFEGMSFFSKFILDDAIFCLLWLYFTTSIQTNGKILLSSQEFSFNPYRLNNELVLNVFQFLKPRIKNLILNNNENKTFFNDLVVKYQKTEIHWLLSIFFPIPFCSSEHVFDTPPIRTFFYVYQDAFEEAMDWLKSRTFSLTKTVIQLSDWFGGKNVLKGVANYWFPETLIVVFFKLISSGTLSSTNINWFEHKIKFTRSARNNPQWVDSFIWKVRKILNPNNPYGFELLIEQPFEVIDAQDLLPSMYNTASVDSNLVTMSTASGNTPLQRGLNLENIEQDYFTAGNSLARRVIV